MNNSIIAGKMKCQIELFSGILSKGLPKTSKRLVKEVVYGIQVKQKVRITEISRSLNERIKLKKTEDRICHQLNRKGLHEIVIKNILKEGSERIKRDSLLIIDPSDITKKYAKKMEYLAKVRDGSEGEINDGYWLMQIIGAELEEVKITPLYGHLYSQAAPDFESENREIIKGISQVINKTKNRGIWVMDRGGDRRELYKYLLKREQRFIMRLVGHRDLKYKGKLILAEKLALSCNMLYEEKILKEEDKKEKVYTIKFGYKKVKLPGYKDELYMVVVRGFGQKPMMILTNVDCRNNRQSLLKIILSYIRRWQIEDTIRFVKQSYNLEDIRLLTYRRLQNMIALVMGTMYFACVWLGDKIKLNILTHHALKAAKRLFGIPDFRYYAIADGIKEIFAGYKGNFCKKSLPKSLFAQTLMFEP